MLRNYHCYDKDYNYNQFTGVLKPLAW